MTDNRTPFLQIRLMFAVLFPQRGGQRAEVWRGGRGMCQPSWWRTPGGSASPRSRGPSPPRPPCRPPASSPPSCCCMRGWQECPCCLPSPLPAVGRRYCSGRLCCRPCPSPSWSGGVSGYRPKARPMWERCLRALSQDSTEEPGRCLDDLDSVAMVSRSAETKRATLFTMERGTGKPFLPNHSTALQSRVHYLQVPANRRHSHDDSDSWSHTPSNSLLPRWSSSDDIVSNRHRLPVGSGALSLHHFLEMLPPPDAQRCIESMKEATSPCFSRQEVMRFIDQDDLFMAQRCHHSNQARRASLAVVMTTPTLTCSERTHRGRRQRPARRASLSGPNSQNLRELHCGEHRDWD
ncbi:probable G-protein coupled receptor 162 isoform X2 [Acipenser ruthenus]|uniref:probable G-protein coupled receptor 162 isoform X2 n=1 Tax=Acipenser ruthenus TaxID=7906 RepID=UPI0027408957|nr:probable G-protein coupled receptor 162 isoform X2 [Acipenser ruthenus]